MQGKLGDWMWVMDVGTFFTQTGIEAATQTELPW
jgi:hypothetical protein